MPAQDGDSQAETGGEPWKEESNEAFADQAATELAYLFKPQDNPDRIEFTGPCPRCDDPFEYTWPLEVVRTAFAAETSPVVIPVTVLCQCSGTHSGRPKETPHGCGAYWNLAVPMP